MNTRTICMTKFITKNPCKYHYLQGFSLMPAVGLEPTRCCQQQILSLPRLPFRHAGISYEHIDTIINKNKLQAQI